MGNWAKPSRLFLASTALVWICVSISGFAQDQEKGKDKAASSTAAGHARSGGTAAHGSKSKKTTPSKKSSRKRMARGQQKIDAQRAGEIQAALIREHYLSGEADGNWNAGSEEAMRRYQADHGWQSKTVPDSRALISLGLGPNHDRLLNPESAMTTEPPAARLGGVTTASQSISPGAEKATTPVRTTPSPTSDPPSVTAPQQGPVNPQ